MAKSPAFQFYPRDFLSDAKVIRMEPDMVGAYTRLLCVCWLEGSLDTDPEELRLLTGVSEERWPVVWERVRPCFSLKRGRYVHKRLSNERKKQRDRRTKMKKAGTAGAAKRWEKRRGSHSKAIDTPMGSDSSSSSSSTSVEEKPIGGAAVLWPVYVEVVAKPSGKAVTLTAARRQKLQALWDEQLGKRPDPEALFRRLCVALRSSEHHASKWEYLLPESFLRSPERRERWVNKAAGGPAGDADTVKVDRMTQLAEKWG